MRTIFGDTRVMMILAALLAIAGFLAGCVLKDFTWFSRSGALVVAVGITLLSRASVIREDIRAHVLQRDTGLSHLDPEHYTRTGEPIPQWVREDQRTRMAVGVWGPLVSLAGTLIGAFGDLLNRLIS